MKLSPWFSSVAILIAMSGGACSHPEMPTVPNQPDQPSAPMLTCALDVQRIGPSLGLAFVLSNHATHPKTIHYFRPFMQFDLHVLAEGRELTIVRGDFDGPVTPAELQLPAGGTARLETPVTLQFAAQAATSSDALRWTVVGEPRSVEIRATLRIEHESFPDCIAHIDRS
jgi:hypothetical protein